MLVSQEGSESYMKQNSPELLWQQSPSLDIGFLGYLQAIEEEFNSLLFIRDAQQ